MRTLKINTLPSVKEQSWCDRDTIMLHACFQILVDWVEKEGGLTDAVEQIKARDYGNTEPKKAELLRIAAVFNADPKVRAFTEYQKVV